MRAMVESTERRSKGILSKLFDAADAIKKVAIYVGCLTAFVGVIGVSATISLADKLKAPAYCYEDTHMVGDYLIAGVKSDDTVIACLPSDPSVYYTITLSTKSWSKLSALDKFIATGCGGVATDYITVESIEPATTAVTPVEIIEIQEAK